MNLFDTIQLYDRPLPKPASARNAIGEVAEEFACSVLAMERQKVNGSLSICPDALLDGQPAEIKSVGKNGRALIYKWRLEKELSAFGMGYRYVFVRHTASITLARGREIVDLFKSNPPRLLITTLGAIIDAIGNTPPRKFKLFQKEYFNKYGREAGFNRKGYVDGGWQFGLDSIKWIDSQMLPAQWAGASLLVKVYRT